MSDAASKPSPAKPAPTPTAPMRKRSEQTGPDLKTLTRAWLESHRASLLDSLRRLAKQPIGSFFTCLVMAVALSFNDWWHIKLFGLNIFDLLDTLTTKIMMPTAGLLIALFVGWRMQRAHVEDEIALTAGSFKLWFAVLRYLSPVAIVLIFLNVIGVIG